MKPRPVALVDPSRRSVLVGDVLYAVLDRHENADSAHVHALPDGAWLGRVDAKGIRPATYGVHLGGHARRRKALRALGAIQRALWPQSEGR